MWSTSVLATLLPLLALTADARIGGAGAHAPRAHNALAAKRAAEAQPAPAPAAAIDQPLSFDRVRRDAAANLSARSNGGKKRKVKKRKAGCIAQTGFAANSSVAATASVSGTTKTASMTITNGWLATGSASASASVSASASASASSTTPSASTSSSAPAASATYSSDWSLVEAWQGNTFFDHVNFWSWDDPTHGTVQYVDAGTAWNEGLISINGQGHALMKVDTTQQVSGGRKSIRVHGNLVYTGGLVLMDAVHMPEGCGTWPAWWSNGPNWPYNGEIDILEGVNAFTQNQVSLHTGSGCKMPNSGMSMTGALTTGGYDSYNCASYETANQGCGVRDQQTQNAYGEGFNSIGGGVYAMEWTSAAINVWFFPRSSIPGDITAGQPVPSGWGTPMANFPGTDCNPMQFFKDHYNIFDTTFCGDWAGADAVWNYAGYAGQDQSCAAKTGYSTCADYVLNNGNAFQDAYWEVSYVKYFNSTSV